MKCPSCTEILAENATRCDCGWKRAGKSADGEDVDSAGRERQCSFMLDRDERCPNRATWIPGGSRRGFCQKHTRSEDVGIIACPPEIKAQISAFLRRTNVSKPARMREPGEEG